jgi:hypothetical protein
MAPEHRDSLCIRGASKGTDEQSAPHGYVEPNGVVVIWKTPTSQHNVSTLEKAKAMCPNLVLLNDAGIFQGDF